jgi:hypothetical protein
VFAGKKSAQIREILISESAWEEMTCLFAPSLRDLVHRILPFHFGFILSLALEFKFKGMAHAGFTDGFSHIPAVTHHCS